MGNGLHHEPSTDAVDVPYAVRAAQYVRMSTEHQRYSTENQAEEIRKYAVARGLTIVRSYDDQARSGLSIDGREALQRLMHDVQNGNADFDTVLVYDVSRWGRFQDADESAYYEHLCKRSGIHVEYCAEQFDNDGSPYSAIVKGIKRAMAGEYSRELSEKVSAGQRRLVGLGFHIGGQPGYGLRRILVDHAGKPRRELKRGQIKALQSDHVVLEPGPPHAVRTVQWIFRAFVDERLGEQSIANELNLQRIVGPGGRPWRREQIHRMLIDEKYVGTLIWNRQSFKLHQHRVQNPPEQWVRVENAIDPIIDRAQFANAQERINQRKLRLSPERMLEGLRDLFEERGSLSQEIINECRLIPSSTTYRRVFGGLVEAYRQAGYLPAKDYREAGTRRTCRLVRERVLAEIRRAIMHSGGAVTPGFDRRVVTLNSDFSVAVAVMACGDAWPGTPRWYAWQNAVVESDICVLVRLDRHNQSILDYYIVPYLQLPHRPFRLALRAGPELEPFRSDDLSPLLALAAAAPIPGDGDEFICPKR